MAFDQKDRPVVFGGYLAPHNGLNPHLPSDLKKENQSINSVDISQGQSVHTLLFGGPAEFFNGAHTPPFGIVRMDVEMDKGHGLNPKAHGTGRKAQGIRERVHGARRKAQG
jgi:hypothetical protein